jgi:hypothetical protein
MSNRLEEIQKEFAQEHGADNWFELISNINETHDPRIDGYYHEVYMKYLSECCKASLEKAENTLEETYLQGNLISYYDIQSIDDEQNITLL